MPFKGPDSKTATFDGATWPFDQAHFADADADVAITLADLTTMQEEYYVFTYVLQIIVAGTSITTTFLHFMTFVIMLLYYVSKFIDSP